MQLEIIKFVGYSLLIVLISKYILAAYLRKLAEALDLKAKNIGNVSGIATSVPELLTITTSTLRGLAEASVYNVLSSNIINILQYLGSLVLNKNIKKLKNNAVKTDFILAILTIIIPVALMMLKIELNIFMVPIFILLHIFFRYLDNNAHKVYLSKEDKKIENEIETERKGIKENQRKAMRYIIILLITGVVLFIISELLGNTLDILCKILNIPEVIIGILLGIITSMPELITFFEAQKHGKKQNEEMLGVIEATNNLLTSNMFNLFIVQTIGIMLITLM